MNCHLLFLICVGFHCAICAPAEQQEKSMYDAIVEKCPSVESLSTYKNSPVFKTCSNWGTISVMEKSPNNKDIQCLLYYNSFVQYCSNRANVNTTVLQDVIAKYTLQDVCNYAETVPDMKSIFSKNDICKEICDDGFGYVVSICAVSVYFSSQKIGTETHENNKPLTSPDKQIQHTIKKSPENQPNPNTNSNKETNQAAEQAKAQLVDILEGGINPPLPQPAADIPQPQAPVEDLNKNSGLLDNEKSTTEQQKTDKVNTSKKILVEQQSEVGAPEHSKSQVEPKGDTPVKHKENANLKVVNEPDGNLEANPNPQPLPISNNVDEIPEQEKTDQNPSDTDIVEDDDVPIDGDEMINLPSSNNGASDKAMKPLQIDETDSAVSSTTEMDGDSYFFTYFMVLCIIFIAGYVCYHNKQKILALILEGRRGKRQYRGRRPNSANYHKLDSNLEEAITSSCKKNTNNVIY